MSEDVRLAQLVGLAAEYYWEQDVDQRFTYVLCAPRYAARHDRDGFLGKTFRELDEFSSTPAPLWNQYQQTFLARRPIRDCVVWHDSNQHGSLYYSISGV